MKLYSYSATNTAEAINLQRQAAYLMDTHLYVNGILVTGEAKPGTSSTFVESTDRVIRIERFTEFTIEFK